MTLGYRQSKTGAWDILIDLDKALEDALLVLLSHTLTGIEHPKSELIALRQIEAYGDGTCGIQLSGG